MTENKQALPGHETQSDEMNCPGCGRFVGAVTKCPYCGSKVEKRMSLVALRWAAVLLSTIGLFLLFLMAKHREVPVVMLGNIQPTMNFGQIRVIGWAKGDALQNRTGGGWRFTVDDGTDSIMVWISKKQAEELADSNRLPRAGDNVNFVGGLNISDESSSLRLTSASEFQLTRAPAATARLADITTGMKGSSVTISGKVLELVPPPAGSKRPYSLKVADDSGEQTINFWQSEYDQIENPDALNGAWVRARVSVAGYKGKLQLKLSSGVDLEILDSPPPPVEAKSPAQRAAAAYQEQTAAPRDFSRGRLVGPVPIAGITAAQDGENVKIRGRVISIRPPKAGTEQPFSLILKEDEATIRATYWSNVDDVIAVKPAPGALFEVEGRVEIYRDKPQLKVQSGYKVIQIEAAAPTEVPAAGAVSSITAADKGQVRTLEGTLGTPRDLGKGTAYALSDDSGSIDLILWHSTVPAETRESLSEGLQVSATGEIGEYDGKLQLKANPGESIRVLNP